MNDPCDVINLRSEVVSADAHGVEYCPRPRCGSPVVIADGAMDRHERRIHIPKAAAAPSVNVQNWERQW